MPWHLPKSWLPGDVRLTAPILNYELRDELLYLYANLAAIIPPAEGWTDVTLFSGLWANLGGGEASAAYYKDPWGLVHLRGVVDGDTAPSSIFTLPTGYRPEHTSYFIVRSTVSGGADGYSGINIEPSGDVNLTFGTPWVALDNIHFRVV